MACLKTAQIAVRFANVAYAFQRPTSRVNIHYRGRPSVM